MGGLQSGGWRSDSLCIGIFLDGESVGWWEVRSRNDHLEVYFDN